ncbi:hypothetical protein [Mycolicibacterium diernhoferi]|uniref:MFS transporter n=1 Tax=Mycolicibacterium diernhoferi TaxID=1801 RepID=A0A1Q4H6A8_9MYCO|nr:hypothetical protein [Mycolicibacterium diernhoferi]OJZ63096.1 hypothetical protein BRW64_23405 [Mycolicibacterium diernhoferi]OPE46706.1 hypothetical protein BV510_26005 [Mycolicibacterium diernhoferi]PEG53226.1 hypothetical protein CRI78_17755 [Mycolicibacterium diernhoferi]QYL21866.1 hypothetical protein K0O62_23225 [Mycolicibacterium diernhoferi]
MTSPTTRARGLRAALVGVSAAAGTTGAHAAASGSFPHGAALMAALLVCATAGAAAAGIRLHNRHAQRLGLIAALGAAQLLGHLTLAMTGGHHGSPGLDMSPSMLAAHAAAAVVLGVAIGAVEHLYLVCSSVLRWLRLFATRTPRPAPKRIRRHTNNVVAQSLLWHTGLGMRAPPMGERATA